MSQRSTSVFTNFTSGEISPTAGARIDITQYNNSAREIENGVVQIQGGVEKRPGTYYVGPTKFVGKKARLIPFKYNFTQEFMMEFGEKYTRLFANGGGFTPKVQGNAKAITLAANNGSGAIRITCVGHGFVSGNTVVIEGVTGTTEANGTWEITVITEDTFDLLLSTFVHTYVLPAPPELITNGSFATNFSGWRFVDGTVFGPGFDPANPLPNFEIVAGGQSGNCLVVDANYRYDGYMNYSPTSFIQNISGLVVGQTYVFSIFTKKPVLYGGTFAFTVGIGGLGGDETSFIASVSGTASSSWVKSTLIWVCTQPGISILLSFFNSEGMLFDTASFKTTALSTYGGTASVSLTEIATPYLADDLFGIDYTQSGDVLYIAHPNYPPATLSRYAGNVWKYEIVSFTYGDIAVLSAGPGRSGQVRITSPGHSLMSGDTVYIVGVVGVPAANGFFLVNVIDTDNFDLILSALTGAPVTNAVDSGSGSIKVTVTSHGFLTGDMVRIGGVDGTFEANGVWRITFVDGDNFILQNSNFVNAFTGAGWCSALSAYGYISGGSIARVQPITGVANNGAGRIRITENGHGFEDGQGITISSVTGTTEANGIWEIDVIDDNNYDLINSTFVHAYVSGGYAVPNLFATPNNYPSSICFFEQRLCWAGTYNKPQTVWLSCVADYLNMIMGSNASDALEYSLAMGGVDVISWIVPWNYMLVGAPDGEWRFGGSSTGNPISPTSVIAKIQSNIGSSKDVKATMLGDIAVFQQYYGSKLYQMGYNFISDSFTVDDLTKLSSHILKPGIRQMAVRQAPDTTLYMVRTDGQLVAMTFYKEEKVIAFSRIVSPGGSGTDTIESCAVIHGDYEDELWVIVNRTINGVATRLIEYFTPRDFMIGLPVPPVRAYPFNYVDCALTYDGGEPQPITGATNTKPVVITYTGTPPANGQYVRIQNVLGMTGLNQNGLLVANLNTTAKTFEVMIDGTVADFGTYESGGTYMIVAKIVSGGEHLAGELVSICADGRPLPSQTMPVNGHLIFADYYNIITIGFPYAMTLRPQYPEINNATGTSAGVQKQVEKLSIRLYNTIGLKVGQDTGNLQEVIFDTDQSVDSGLFNGDKEVEFIGGVKTTADISVVHDYPLPCTVLGILTLMTVLDR